MKMNEDESITNYFLRIGEFVNARRGLGEKIEERDVVSKVVRILLPKIETKISTLEENKNLFNLTLHQTQGTLLHMK